LIHVLDPPGTGPGMFELHAADAAARRERLYQHARLRLKALVGRLDGNAEQVATEVRTGGTAESIAEAAIRYGANLVIMATHRRQGLARVMARSVAARVMRTAACPVLVIRESGQVHVHGQPVRECAQGSGPLSRAPKTRAAS
jgi:nucleotide-binding universal stress UspA family protein